MLRVVVIRLVRIVRFVFQRCEQFVWIVFQWCEQLVPSPEFLRRFFLLRQQLAPEFIGSLEQRRVRCTVLFRRQWFRVVGHFGILRHVVRQSVAFRFTRAAVLVG